MLSDYFTKHYQTDLLDKSKIQKIVFGSDEKKNEEIISLEKKLGIKIEITIESILPDKRGEAVVDTIFKAETLGKVVQILISCGYNEEEAKNMAALMHPETNVNQKNWNMNIKGL